MKDGDSAVGQILLIIILLVSAITLGLLYQHSKAGVEGASSANAATSIEYGNCLANLISQVPKPIGCETMQAILENCNPVGDFASMCGDTSTTSCNCVDDLSGNVVCSAIMAQLCEAQTNRKSCGNADELCVWSNR